jgi:cystathionine beta-lyase
MTGSRGAALHWRTALIHADATPPGEFNALVPAVHRGSTVVFTRLAEARDDWRQDAGYTYGLYGTPTTRELGLRIARLEGASHTVLVPGGQAALALVYFSYCTAGSHVLVPESAYGPSLELASGLLSGLGVEVEAYDPLVGAGIAELLRPNTALVWCESPGSITMDVQDVPAIVRSSHARGVAVALDNTYAAGILFDAFACDVDVSIQALTKYVGGHSDILLGSVSARDDAAYERIGRVHRLLGMAVSPDDCALALRGLQTLGIRLERLERTALTVAKWLSDRAEIEVVLHPALPGCPGHAVWKRDFSGSASVFSIVVESSWDEDRVTRFVEALRLFRLGFSWGGVTSLVMAYPRSQRLSLKKYGPRVIRLNVGLEEADDLIGDLSNAFEATSVR